MDTLAALIYWAAVSLWITVLCRIVVLYRDGTEVFGTTRLLLGVVALDTFRNIIENSYFGLYFGAKYGFFPSALVSLLGQPGLLILPKLLNILAGCVVLGLLLLKWLPHAARERSDVQDRVQRMEMLAGTDPLTGTSNRRRFEALAHAEMGRCQRYGHSLTLLMVDIDHFKSVNDRFGHAVGDRVLRSIAETCRACKRETDVLARLGGEEFVLLLPETSTVSAVALAERLRGAIRAQKHEVDDGGLLQVSASIGLATATSETSVIETLLVQADKALYAAKRAGRNQVSVFAPDAPFDHDQQAPNALAGTIRTCVPAKF